MTRICLCICALACLISCNRPATQNGTNSPKQAIAKEDALTCDQHVQSFGVAQVGETVTCVFTVKNSSDRMRSVATIKTSCGCSSANVSKKTLSPHEEALVTAEVSLDAPGARRYTIVVIDNEGKTLNLQIKGHAIAQASRVQVGVPLKLELGSLPIGRVDEVYLVAPGKHEPKIVAAAGSLSVKAKRLSPQYLALTVSTNAHAQTGPASSHVRLGVGGDVYDVELRGRIMSDLYASTNSIDFCSESSPSAAFITISSRSNRRFAIAEIDSPNGVRVELGKPEPHGYRIRVRISNFSGKKICGGTIRFRAEEEERFIGLLLMRGDR